MGLRRFFTNKKGFTLMEVMVAIAVIAIISGPLLQTFITSTRVGRHSYDTDKANALTVKMVEQIKAAPNIGDSTDFTEGTTLDEHGVEVPIYTRIDYYDIDWEHADDESSAHPFRMVTTLTGSPDSSSVSPYSISALVCKSGPNEGETYRLEIFPSSIISPNTYEITITQDGDYYIVENPSILKNSLEGSSGYPLPRHEIPVADCMDEKIPIVMDAEILEGIVFKVNNQAAVTVYFYIFEDYDSGEAGEHFDVVSGHMATESIPVSSAMLDYDKLDVNVKVTREENGRVLTDYTTLVYLAQ